MHSYFRKLPDDQPFEKGRLPLAQDTVRSELIERVRQEIAQGTYDTPEKMETALERLFARVFDVTWDSAF